MDLPVEATEFVLREADRARIDKLIAETRARKGMKSLK